MQVCTSTSNRMRLAKIVFSKMPPVNRCSNTRIDEKSTIPKVNFSFQQTFLPLPSLTNLFRIDTYGFLSGIHWSFDAAVVLTTCAFSLWRKYQRRAELPQSSTIVIQNPRLCQHILQFAYNIYRVKSVSVMGSAWKCFKQCWKGDSNEPKAQARPERGNLRQSEDSPVGEKTRPAPACPTFTRDVSLTGRNRGIQGSNNSCYLDALLLSLFYTTNIFDGLLNPKTETDDNTATEVRKILKDQIAHPLQTKRYCSAGQVGVLRSALRPFNGKIMGTFMAPEEIIYLLFERILNEEKFIKYNGHADFMHIMTVDPRDPAVMQNVQTMFKNSLKIYGNMKLESVPCPALLLGLPWDNGKLVKYQGITPNLILNIEDSLKSETCSICSKVAIWETSQGATLPKYYCKTCAKQLELEEARALISRREMRLLAVICFRGAHFTCFVRKPNGTKGLAQWLFFDSMAGGYPEVRSAENFESWTVNAISKPKGKGQKRKHNNASFQQIQNLHREIHTCIYEPVLYK